MEQKDKLLEKDFSFHADPYMKWEDTRICHDCLNRLPMAEGACDVFDDINLVNHAIRSEKCEYYIKKQSID